MRTSQVQGRRNIAWVKAFLEARNEGRHVVLLEDTEWLQMTLPLEECLA